MLGGRSIKISTSAQSDRNKKEKDDSTRPSVNVVKYFAEGYPKSLQQKRALVLGASVSEEKCFWFCSRIP